MQSYKITLIYPPPYQLKYVNGNAYPLIYYKGRRPCPGAEGSGDGDRQRCGARHGRARTHTGIDIVRMGGSPVRKKVIKWRLSGAQAKRHGLIRL